LGIEFARDYQALTAEQREALKMQSRREWWAAYQEKLPIMRADLKEASDRAMQGAGNASAGDRGVRRG
jgi:hypothetical protein